MRYQSAAKLKKKKENPKDRKVILHLKTDSMPTQSKWRKSYEADLESNTGLFISATNTHELIIVTKQINILTSTRYSEMHSMEQWWPNKEPDRPNNPASRRRLHYNFLNYLVQIFSKCHWSHYTVNCQGVVYVLWRGLEMPSRYDDCIFRGLLFLNYVFYYF